jgi:hypothetical protein
VRVVVSSRSTVSRSNSDFGAIGPPEVGSVA